MNIVIERAVPVLADSSVAARAAAVTPGECTRVPIRQLCRCAQAASKPRATRIPSRCLSFYPQRYLLTKQPGNVDWGGGPFCDNARRP